VPLTDNKSHEGQEEEVVVQEVEGEEAGKEKTG
jgi:hypothetical protein